MCSTSSCSAPHTFYLRTTQRGWNPPLYPSKHLVRVSSSWASLPPPTLFPTSALSLTNLMALPFHLRGIFFLCALFTDFASHMSVNFLKDLGSARLSSSSSSFYLFLSLSCQLVSLIAVSAQDLSMWHFLVGFSALRPVALCRLGRVPQAAPLGVS